MRNCLVVVVLVLTGGCSASPQADGRSDAGGDAVVPAPIRIIRGDPATTSWLTLTIEGHGLTALEGRLVSVRIGMPDRAPERLGSGQARVEAGAFSLTFPNVWEPGGVYKQKLVFVDTDGDGACTGADQTCLDYRGSQVDITLTLPGSEPPGAINQELAPGTGPAEACALWNMPWPDI